MALNPPKPHSHTSHSCKISRQHPQYVDISLEAKKLFENLVIFLRGPSSNFDFFLFFAQSFWNFHTICEIDLRSIFCYKFCFFNSIFMIIAFFRKKKTPFIHSIKKNRSLWVFIVQIWFTYQNEAKTIRKASLALFFFNLVWIIFHEPSNRKKLKSVIFRQLFDFRSILLKNRAENEKSRAELLFHIISAMFWYASHLCSIWTDWVLLFLINLFWSWENRPQSFDKVNKWIPIIHAYPLFWGGSRARRLVIFLHVNNQTLKITFRHQKNTTFWPNLARRPPEHTTI